MKFGKLARRLEEIYQQNFVWIHTGKLYLTKR